MSASDAHLTESRGEKPPSLLEVAPSLGNLNDVFMDASVVRDRMLKSPIEIDPRIMLDTDHFRLERLWVALLAVLVESWDAPQMRPAREFLKVVTSTSRLEDLLARVEEGSAYEYLRSTRGYMFHRDRREYWDRGRSDLIGKLPLTEELHLEFSRVLLAGLRAFNEASEKGRATTVQDTPDGLTKDEIKIVEVK